MKLDDAAMLSVNAAPCSPLGGGGSYRPTGLLSSFNGQSALGNWRLLVTNTNNISCGNLETFSINICGNRVDMMMITKVSVLTNDNECEFVVLNKNLDPAFSDNCAGALLTHNYIFGPFDNTLQGAVLPLGETTVVWTATDAAGNVRTCTIIYEVKDKNKPEFINCPDPDYIQDAEPGICGAYVNFSLPIAFDACDGQLEVRQVDNTGLFTGSVFPVGMSISPGCSGGTIFRTTHSSICRGYPSCLVRQSLLSLSAPIGHRRLSDPRNLFPSRLRERP